MPHTAPGQSHLVNSALVNLINSHKVLIFSETFPQLGSRPATLIKSCEIAKLCPQKPQSDIQTESEPNLTSIQTPLWPAQSWNWTSTRIFFRIRIRMIYFHRKWFKFTLLKNYCLMSPIFVLVINQSFDRKTSFILSL